MSGPIKPGAERLDAAANEKDPQAYFLEIRDVLLDVLARRGLLRNNLRR